MSAGIRSSGQRIWLIRLSRLHSDPLAGICTLFRLPRSTGQTARSSILFSAGLVPIQDVSTLVSVPQKSPSCKRNFPRPAPVSAPSLRIFDPFASCSAASSPLLLAPPVLLAAFASPFQSRTYSLRDKKVPITSRGCNRGRNRKSPLTEISGLKSYEIIVCYRNLSAIAKFQTHFWRKLGVNWRKLWRKHRQFWGNQ